MANVFVCLSYSAPQAALGRNLSKKLEDVGYAVFHSLQADDGAVTAQVANSSGGSRVVQHPSQAGNPPMTARINDALAGASGQDLQVILRPDAGVDTMMSDISTAIGKARQRATQDDEALAEQKEEQKKASQAQTEASAVNWFTALGCNALGAVFLIAASRLGVGIISDLKPPPGGDPDVFSLLGRAVLEIGPLGACAWFAFRLGGSYMAESQRCGDRVWALVPMTPPAATSPSAAKQG